MTVHQLPSGRFHVRLMRPAPAWAGMLGPRPVDPTERTPWLTAATAVAAYRERYETPPHHTLLGPRPAGIRPEAQAAYDHAQHAIDRHAVRRLHHLTPEQLCELGRRQQTILAQQPDFDPAELERAHRQHAAQQTSEMTASGATSAARIELLEQQADDHRRWRDAAQTAAAVLRQIHHLQQHRRRRDSILSRR